MLRERGHLSRPIQTTSEYPRISVMTIGESGVGKSCLIKRYCEGKFVDAYISTIGIDYGLKTVEMDERIVKVNFFDTAGDVVYSEITREFYKDVDGLILVCDISDRLSFQKLTKLLQEFKNHNSKVIPITLALSKSDSIDDELLYKAIKKQEIEQFCATNECEWFIVSSLSGDGVQQLFESLFKRVLKDS